MNKKILSVFLLSLSVLIPASFAGLRDLSCGYDIMGYGIRVWNLATKSESFGNFQLYLSNIEFVYAFLNYVVSRFSNDIHWFLFVHECIVMSLIVCAAFQCRKRFNSEYVFIYMCFYLYCMSFSMLRQSIAVGFVLLAATWIFDNQLRKSSFPISLACLSHNSSFFAILLYPFRIVVNKLYNKKLFLIMMMVIIGFIGFTFYAVILRWLMSVGLYSNHYEAYIGQVGFKTHKIDLALILGIIASLFLFVKKKNRVEPFFSYALCLLVIAFILNLYGSIVEIAVRVAHYFMVSLVVVLPLSARQGGSRQKLELATLFLLIIQFTYLASLNGIESAIPYKSPLLGIN
ncbi:MAG: EpsG family protein [Fibrobacter sp.]|nr:EpsG family protein [Fibrobacter sp.]